MNTKLTLKLDKKAIETARIYAKQHNRSLSGLVENYFLNLLQQDNSYPKKHSPVVENLTAVLTEDDLEQMARNDERARYILKREI